MNEKNTFNKYKFYKKGNTTIAVSSYAGKRVKATAKCDPRDSYNEMDGKHLAAARCNWKIACKRAKRAEKKFIEAKKQKEEADKYFERMHNYMDDSAAAKYIAYRNMKWYEGILSGKERAE